MWENSTTKDFDDWNEHREWKIDEKNLVGPIRDRLLLLVVGLLLILCCFGSGKKFYPRMKRTVF